MPWARPGSGFMLLFGAMVVEPAKSQPVTDIAEPVGGHDTRPWRFIRHYVQEARLWIGNGVLDGFLEDESLFGEFLRTPVSEGPCATTRAASASETQTARIHRRGISPEMARFFTPH